MKEMTMTKQTAETAVPVKEPDVKPSPVRKPKERPDKNDPWTVPAPKVNPTPKAMKKIMKASTENKKEVIDNKADYDAFTQVMTAKAFFAKYTLSMNLVVELASNKGMVYAEFTDRKLTASENIEMKKYLMAGN